MRKLLLFFLFSFLISSVSAQSYLKLSVYAEVSIITVGPGENLYEVFGHSAIRIKDPVLNFDLVYNYGIFDFNAPGFYLNFAKGKLQYLLARYPFQQFVSSYKSDKRWIKEQILNLNKEQKQQFFEYLENNARQENASYLYDPYFNNCSTKLRDISNIILNDSITFNKSYASNKTLRELMNDELHWNSWGSLGINIALGTVLDKKATPTQYLYLPDFVFSAFDKGKIIINGTSQPIVKKETNILIYEEPAYSFSFSSPIVIFSVLFFIGVLITYRDFKKRTRSKWFDFLLFFITGIIGIGIVFLWFFTNHMTTPNNFNILWAFAPNIIIGFFLLKNKYHKRIKKYIWLLLVLLILMLVFWVAGIQLFATAMIPFLLLLAYRYYYLLTLKE
ncbi:MAG: DUF4105 domain-containing protein [Flavobacteriaceae bacterium]